MTTTTTLGYRYYIIIITIPQRNFGKAVVSFSFVETPTGFYMGRNDDGCRCQSSVADDNTPGPLLLDWEPWYVGVPIPKEC